MASSGGKCPLFGNICFDSTGVAIEQSRHLQLCISQLVIYIVLQLCWNSWINANMSEHLEDMRETHQTYDKKLKTNNRQRLILSV